MRETICFKERFFGPQYKLLVGGGGRPVNSPALLVVGAEFIQSPALAAHLREQTKTLVVNQKNQGQNGDFSVRFKMQ